MRRNRFVMGGAVLALSALASLGCSSMKPPPPAASPAPAAAAAPAPPPSPEDLRKAILAQEARRIEAMIKADAQTLDEILRDDLTYVHSSGQLETKAQVIEEITSGKLKYRAILPSEETVRVFGDWALVAGRAQLKATSGGKPVGLWVRFTEVWMQSEKGWQLAAWQSTRLPD